MESGWIPEAFRKEGRGFWRDSWREEAEVRGTNFLLWLHQETGIVATASRRL